MRLPCGFDYASFSFPLLGTHPEKTVSPPSLERTVMKSVQLSSGVNDNVRFWGYHTENSATAMAAWLNGANTLVLLRDRAKVTVINQDADIKSIQELMGHEDIAATQAYLAVTKNRIKDVYDRAHPRA